MRQTTNLAGSVYSSEIYKRYLHGGRTTMLYLNLSGHDLILKKRFGISLEQHCLRGHTKKRLKRRWMRMLSEGGGGDGVYHVADIHKNKYFFYLVSFFFHYRMVNFPILYGRMFLVALKVHNCTPRS